MQKIKFAHLADTHIGSWRDEKMRVLSIQAFEQAVIMILQENVDFVLISGDFFDTSIPPIDKIKSAVTQLKRLKEQDIPIYMISGSHDHSPSGKTMLDVLEEAGLFTNVVKGTIENNKLRLKITTDQKTGTHITGMLGKRGTLEKTFYEQLDRAWLEQQMLQRTGYKIFMFHSSLEEFKQQDQQAMESMPLSLLPLGFQYYAGGHVHLVFQKDETPIGMGLITYPGPTFPCNFKEIEDLKHGGFYIVTYDHNNNHTTATWKPIPLKPTIHLTIDCHNKSAEQAEKDLCEQLITITPQNAIITLRIKGSLSMGKLSDIPFNDIIQALYERGAYFVMKNTVAVTSQLFEEIKKGPEQSIAQMQELIIAEHLGQIKVLTSNLLKSLSAEKHEGEKTADFEKRVIDTADTIFKQVQFTNTH
jgi:DNA repair protein SbcD/Mre11